MYFVISQPIGQVVEVFCKHCVNALLYWNSNLGRCTCLRKFFAFLLGLIRRSITLYVKVTRYDFVLKRLNDQNTDNT